MITATPGHPANSIYCFNTRPFPGNPEDNLSGMGFSGLEVIGYASKYKPTRSGSPWVCRCICGRYEIRRSRPLKRQDRKKVYRCSVCEAERNDRQHEEYIRIAG